MRQERDTGWLSARNSLKSSWEELYPTDRFEDHEEQVRYAFDQSRAMGPRSWNDEVEQKLRRDWQGDWMADADFVMRGWELAQHGPLRYRPEIVRKPLEELPETRHQAPAVTRRPPDPFH